jgi:hypothetical protein
MPTFAALTDGKTPKLTDGLDFSPTLVGKVQPELSDRFLYWEFDKLGLQQQGSRWKNWKAIRDPKTGVIELFDLNNDVGETKNLAADHPDIVARFAEFFGAARTDSLYWPVTATTKVPAEREQSTAPGS